ncbi:phosphoglycolate phosphatase [Pacificibacter maritimus]|uniref:Phosphoglycolate phosphatase n=1 Tax=Pacificibacter maritimus TaxID=762213 RepID=A0A3N4U4P4_9RHOB|nr:HAD-IA family hydrolase [Pacificibacter maritimus]RPE63305.1 phosphoglycolate phosphatase [Pacificibacter maritimus]
MSKLVIFDVDGTLVDSQAHIVASMTAAFDSVALPQPERQAVLSIIGLSLPYAMKELAPMADDQTVAQMVEVYKSDFSANRLRSDAMPPLYDGAEAAIAALASRGDMMLAIATGKSRRGLDALLESWPFADVFATTHCADDHPSKPHPSMVQACLTDCDAQAADAVVVGDTTYDMEMAKAARCASIGVSWGYHGVRALTTTGAAAIVTDFSQLETTLDTIWKD